MCSHLPPLSSPLRPLWEYRAATAKDINRTQAALEARYLPHCRRRPSWASDNVPRVVEDSLRVTLLKGRYEARLAEWTLAAHAAQYAAHKAVQRPTQSLLQLRQRRQRKHRPPAFEAQKWI